MIAKNPINSVTVEPVDNLIDLTSATVELPPDDMPELAKPVVTGATVIEIEQREWIERLEEALARSEAEVARLKAPPAAQYELMKEAVFLTGMSRPTLKRRTDRGQINHERDRQGRLLIDVIDAKAKRFIQAADDGEK
jgi:hypothetical protein